MKYIRNLKRIASVVLATFIIAAVPVEVSAAGLPDQSQDGNASITIHKLGIDSSFVSSSSFTSDGKLITDQSAVIGTLDDENGNTQNVTLGDLNPLQNIPFTLERMVEKKDQNGDVVTPIEYEVDSTFMAITTETAADGTIEFGSLDFGIYRITEEASAAVTKPADPMMVSVPMTNPTNPDEWLYDIHLYPKNEIAGPDIDKSVSYPGNQDDTADLSENVKWIITSQIPADMATSKQYTINDVMGDGLRLNLDSLEVSYLDADTNQKVILDNGLYIVTVYENATSDTFTIELDGSARQEIGNEALPNPIPAGYVLPRLTVGFTTRFDIPEDKIPDYLGVEIENQANLEYTNSANVEYNPETETPEVHTGGIRLQKVDPQGTVLGGAQFQIYRTKADALAGTNAIKDPKNQANDWVATSDSDTGMAEFLGLSYGDRATASTAGDLYNDPTAETTYWIVEVKAPVDAQGKSYNLLRAPLEVTVNATSHEDTNIIKVVNSKFNLPLTGGAGAIIFTVIGLAMVGAGVLFLMKAKKKQM